MFSPTMTPCTELLKGRWRFRTGGPSFPPCKNPIFVTVCPTILRAILVFLYLIQLASFSIRLKRGFGVSHPQGNLLILDSDAAIKIMKLGRLKFPVIGFFMFLFGALQASLLGSNFSLEKILLGYLILFAAELSVSYSNNYFDSDLDRYSEATSFSGGSRILAQDPKLRELTMKIALFWMGLSVILGIMATILFSLPSYFVPYVALGNLASWYYTAPPLRLAYRGFGELVAAITIGLMMPGTGFLIIRGSFDTLFLLFAIPSCLYSFALMISIEIPDMESDKSGRKKTLIVSNGRRFGFNLIVLSFVLSTLYFATFSLFVHLDAGADMVMIAFLCSYRSHFVSQTYLFPLVTER